MDTPTCYCCDNLAAVGQGDHVPPKGIFPKGCFSNTKPIIVPSCQAHNQEQSSSDEYLKFILASASESTPSDVLESTVRGLVRHIKNDSKSLNNYGIELKNNEVILDGSAPVNFGSLCIALKKVARGIYYHHSNGKKKLIGSLVVFPIFLGVDPHASPEERERLINIENLTKYEMENYKMFEVLEKYFSYQVIEYDKVSTINMLFYQDKIVSVCHAKA